MFSFNNSQNGEKVEHFHVIFCEAKHVIQTKNKVILTFYSITRPDQTRQYMVNTRHWTTLDDMEGKNKTKLYSQQATGLYCTPMVPNNGVFS